MSKEELLRIDQLVSEKLGTSIDILSDITHHMKYARYLDEWQRRETFAETVTKNREMHIRKYPELREQIIDAFKYVYDKKVLPSMRSLQFGGKPIEMSPNRIFNCAYAPMDDWRAFSEIIFLLLGGTGVGFSVQKHHVEQLPTIQKPVERKRRFLVGDSIEGWSDAIKVLMKAYFTGSSTPVFDFSDVRPKGARLITSGGKAPGPQPLKDCLHNITGILDHKEDGEQLTTLEVHDIVCYIADAVLAGGIRRAALISLFSFDDQEMLTSKFGNWWELNPQRARANNTAVALRYRIKEDEFFDFMKKVEASGSGEPGIFFTNDPEWGLNPCAEVSLRKNQFCNLVTINASDLESQEDLNKRAKAASFIATLQAGYTDFHYLRDIWKRNTEKDGLLGVSMTGIASGDVLRYNLKEAAHEVLKENRIVANAIGIKPAARSTTVKPEGTASLLLGTSSGIHAWHAKYYIRRIRVGKNESLYTYLLINHPELLEDDYFKPDSQAVISIPVKAPEGSILRDEDVMDLLDRIKRFNLEWIGGGHVSGANKHNVSATVAIKSDEWEKVSQWMWENRDSYNGLSVLPYDGGTYVQAPFEEIDEARYLEMLKELKGIDLTKVIEIEDNTVHSEVVACGGGACEIV
ncbi:hypothetical protein [Acinetobacter sp.]|uniref:hypothetical protein n=1 Tax=Acinetobacter sp. TaxID=472 RepID=UPI003CFF4BFA